MPLIYNFFQKTEAEEILHNLFYRASITLVSKSDKDIIRKGKYRPICLIKKHMPECTHMAVQEPTTQLHAFLHTHTHTHTLKHTGSALHNDSTPTNIPRWHMHQSGPQSAGPVHPRAPQRPSVGRSQGDVPGPQHRDLAVHLGWVVTSTTGSIHSPPSRWHETWRGCHILR